MMFFFKIEADREIVAQDPGGTELPNLDAARDEAIAPARELAAAAASVGREDGPDQILITDATGRLLDSVSLPDMILKRLRK
jgi:hypothetical protein